MIGRAEIVNVQAGTGRSFSCGVNCPCGLYFGVASLSPASYTGAIGDVGNPFSPQYTTQDCQGTAYGPFFGTANSWSSSDATVMSITNAGQASCLKAGTTSITAQETGWTYAGSSCLYTTFPANASGGGTVVSVQVTMVDLTSDLVTVSLSGSSGTSGQLVVTWNGPAGNAQIANSINGPGTYTFNPSLSGLKLGQYTGVTATWTVNGKQTSGNKDYSFNVLGTWRHSQYNTPTESTCAGLTSSAYEVNLTTCGHQTNNLIVQFISQSWLNGSGIASSEYYTYSSEQNAQFCINHGYLPADATGKSFAFEPNIVPYCGSGYSLGTNTVAWNFSSSTLTCGDQLLLVGYGGPNGTVKTLTDRCGAACANAQLDNYTTVSKCNPHDFTDLGNFTTIRLGR